MFQIEIQRLRMITLAYKKAMALEKFFFTLTKRKIKPSKALDPSAFCSPPFKFFRPVFK